MSTWSLDRLRHHDTSPLLTWNTQLSMSDTSLAWGESRSDRWEDDSKLKPRHVLSRFTMAWIWSSMQSLFLEVRFSALIYVANIGSKKQMLKTRIKIIIQNRRRTCGFYSDNSSSMRDSRWQGHSVTVTSDSRHLHLIIFAVCNWLYMMFILLNGIGNQMKLCSVRGLSLLYENEDVVRW